MQRTFLLWSSASPADSDRCTKRVKERSLRGVAPHVQARLLVIIASVAFLVITLRSGAAVHDSSTHAEREQVPTWSAKDMEFFLHGSMSAEVIPEGVLGAFIKTYPDLFATNDLTHLGLIPDPEFGWPIGISRANVKHLGGLPSLGINCASCHFAQITSESVDQPIRILGVTSHFDVEKFFGSILAATFKTSDPANMKKFLGIYLNADAKAFDAKWQNQEQQIIAIMRNDPFGTKGVPVGELHKIDNADVRQSFEPDIDLAARAKSMLQLLPQYASCRAHSRSTARKARFRTGTNDAFGLLAAALLNLPQPYSPIKFGLVWNIDKRTWVHWDGNTKSPITQSARIARARRTASWQTR